MAQVNVTLNTDLIHGLFTSDGRDGAFSELIETLLNQILSAQATEQLQAEPYEQTELRTDYRNGTRERAMNTRVGTLTLQVPRFRNGTFDSAMFSNYQRSEVALIAAMIEMVVNGVSSRKVRAITEELCGTGFSKSSVSEMCKTLDPAVAEFRNRALDAHYPFVIVDAIYLKVREDGHVRSKGFLMAIGVNADGMREIVGFDIAEGESEQSWARFFKSLKARGLKGVDHLVSDAHTGLVKAIRSEFADTTWQRCQTHFSRNVLDATPKRHRQDMQDRLHLICCAKDQTEACRYLAETLEMFRGKADKALDILEDGFVDATAVLALPKRYRRRLRTSNSIERLNEEIRRRERVIRIFPNEASAIRIIGALLVERHECYVSGKRYLDMSEYNELIQRPKKREPESIRQKEEGEMAA
jgi:transposase-like protein